MGGDPFRDELEDFPCDDPTVADWLPGETLFSVCSRHHWVAGNVKASETCLQLFGHPRTGSAHDLPSRINRFVHRTAGRFGTAVDIIRRHTLLPFYLPFRSCKVAADAVAAMTGDTSGPMKAQLGILAARFGAAHPLKACPQCVHEDQQVHQVAYWHVEHQLPGVWTCTRHGGLLMVSQLKSTGVERHGWCLPTTARLVPCAGGPLAPEGMAVLHSMAVAALRIWSLPAGSQLSITRLASLYRSALKDAGLASPTGRIRDEAFGEAIARTTGPLTSIWELTSLPRSALEGSSQFNRVLSNTRAPAHPLRHLIVIQTLFGGWDAMWSRYNACREDPDQTETLQDHAVQALTIADVARAEKRAKVTADLTSNDLSMRAIAIRHNVSVATVMAWAAFAGTAARRRPKLLKPLLRERLVRALRLGVDKACIAQSLSISIETVTSTLRTEVGLHAHWKQARFDRTQRATRSAWEGTANSLATPTPKAMRSLQPAVYAWLYRNDRAWLENSLTQIPRAPKSNHVRINWDQRDFDMSNAIRVAALDWHIKKSGRRLTIATLCEVVPGLKARLSALDQMPLSRAALSEVSGRRRKAPQFL